MTVWVDRQYRMRNRQRIVQYWQLAMMGYNEQYIATLLGAHIKTVYQYERDSRLEAGGDLRSHIHNVAERLLSEHGIAHDYALAKRLREAQSGKIAA